MDPQRNPLAFIFLVLANLLASVLSTCQNNGNYTSNSTYSTNLNTALSALSRNIDNNGFYTVSVGENPDRANAAALCRGDVQLDWCRTCVQDTAAALLVSCPYQKQAIDWPEFCMVRYSNETMFGYKIFEIDIRPGYWWWNLGNASSPDQFKEDLGKLLYNLTEIAARGSSLIKVAGGNTPAPDFQTIYALVQCTPDLTQDYCSYCLIGAAQDIPRCCDGKRGGRVLGPSCTLRFEVYPFYNETRLQELAPTGSPAVVPAPVVGPPTLSPSGNDNGNKARTITIIVVSIAASMILFVSICIVLRKRMKQRRNEKHEIGEDAVEFSTTESLQYAFSTIEAATNDFSNNNKLGQGGFGAVYKTLPSIQI